MAHLSEHRPRGGGNCFVRSQNREKGSDIWAAFGGDYTEFRRVPAQRINRLGALPDQHLSMLYDDRGSLLLRGVLSQISQVVEIGSRSSDCLCR